MYVHGYVRYVFFFYSWSWSGRRSEVGDGMILVVYLGCLVYVYSKRDWRIRGGGKGIEEGFVRRAWFFLGNIRRNDNT